MKYQSGERRGAANTKHIKRQPLEGTITNQSRTVSVLSTPRWVVRSRAASRRREHTDAAAETLLWPVKQSHVKSNLRTRWVTKSDLGGQGQGHEHALALRPMCLENPPMEE